MILALLFALAVIAGRLYGTAEFARANETNGPTGTAWRTALARSL